MQSRRMSSSASSRTSADIGKHSSSDRGRDQAPKKDDLHCMGCNRSGHLRETCNFRTHPDFNHSGRWEGCRADLELRARVTKDRDIKLTWKHRADGTHSIHLPHLVVLMLTIKIPDDDVIVNVVTVMAVAMAVEAVKVVRAEKVVDKSIGTTTKVRPVVPEVSLTRPATAVELISTAPIVNV